MKIPNGVPIAASFEFAPDVILRVGRLAVSSPGSILFEYDRNFIESGLQLNPRLGTPGTELLGPREPRLFRGLMGVFADSLPDAWGDVLLRRLTARNGIDYQTLSALDRLAIVGHRGMGALIYDPVVELAPAEAVDLEALAAESQRVLAGDESAIIDQLELLGGSPGGARPKILVAINESGDTIAGADVIPRDYSGWLVKFPGPGDPVDIGPLEMVYAEMARAAGVTVTPSRLLRAKNGPGYFATMRFDRGPNGSRTHAVTLASLLDIDWSIPNMTYAGVMNAVRFFTRNEGDVREMFLRMVFNVIAHNRDDHTKQHSFLMTSDGTWSLAPAYDLTFSHGPGGHHYLMVGDESRDIKRSHVQNVAQAQQIQSRVVTSIIDMVCSAVRRFDEFASMYGVSKATRNSVSPALTAALTAFG